MKCILLGTAYPFRGGLAAFNERLMEEFSLQNHEAEIYTFTVQYPDFLFPGKTQYSASPAPENLIIKRKVNSVNPINWRRVGKEIAKRNPDILLIKYWMPFMAPCFGTIAKIVKRNKKTKMICIADNILPHERKPYDRVFTKYFLKHVDACIVMTEHVKNDLKKISPKMPAFYHPHPLFDNFGKKISKQEACATLNLSASKKYILFFGFIRDYKGLDLLLKAFAKNHDENIQLIIAGEYYSNENEYLALIQTLHLQTRVHQFNHFIANEEVKNFFCAADLVVQPYKHATQSGVTQIAYHFEVPMIVTHVGGLAEMVPHNKVGFVTAANEDAIAEAINSFFTLHKEEEFILNIKEEKKKFTWNKMVETILLAAKNN